MLALAHPFHWEVTPIFVGVLAFFVLAAIASRTRRETARTALKLCKSCGTPHPQHARFCRQCGKNLTE